MFTWYWLADVCAAERIAFVLGHALAMKALHGGKNDKLDSFKIASLLRGGLLPQAYVYPAAMRATRDLIRRRLHLVRKRGQLLAHIQNTRAQYNLPAFGRRLAYPANREGVRERFADPGICVLRAARQEPKQSAGKTFGASGAKMGDVHLKWAFSGAAVLFLRHTKDGKKLLSAIEKKHGKGKALSILAHKIGRAVFYMLSRGTVFSTEKFLAA